MYFLLFSVAVKQQTTNSALCAVLAVPATLLFVRSIYRSVALASAF